MCTSLENPSTHTHILNRFSKIVIPQIGGDIEDVDGHACVVCPAHRYKIDMSTGHQIDTDLCGKSCSSAKQKQRLYKVHLDDEFIWVDLPSPTPTTTTTTTTTSLPSDYYNQVTETSSPVSMNNSSSTSSSSIKARGLAATAPSQNYGLLGAAAVAPPPPSFAAPLQPYAGVNGWPVVVPSQGASSSPQMATQTAATSAPQLFFSQHQQQQAVEQQQQHQHQQQPTSLMNFFPSKAKPDPPHVARRKAATAAILNRGYRPPTADNTPMQSPVKPQQPKFVAPVAGMNGSMSGGATRQATLFESWGSRQPAATAVIGGGGADSMDMS